MKLRILICGLVLAGVSACASEEKVEVVKPVILEEPPLVQQVKMFEPNMEELFSNESVIFYPLDKPAGAVKQSFPKYQSVLDNTTAGGYTVFDPSVTVYALDGKSQKPAYLPEYSVPQHAAQYETNMRLEERRAAAAIPPLPEELARPEPSLTRETQQQPRRRPPVLTGY